MSFQTGPFGNIKLAGGTSQITVGGGNRTPDEIGFALGESECRTGACFIARYIGHKIKR
ncbi:hypothetical protein [Candidatus Competibacter denitrificans]|uniref:hypothetical protein n=1 Tax=Candidatus Competibacter denitrificans TaxID=1400862 RepID=UPI001F5BA50A|nr:hypothetical protein [Candidatus Competibacter denitrificans]